MKIERIAIKSTCKLCQGKIAFKIGGSITKDNILPLLMNNGFIEMKHFTKSNILYVESEDLIVSGAFGQNILQTNCKKKDCQVSLNKLESLLINME